MEPEEPLAKELFFSDSTVMSNVYQLLGRDARLALALTAKRPSDAYLPLSVLELLGVEPGGVEEFKLLLNESRKLEYPGFTSLAEKKKWLAKTRDLRKILIKFMSVLRASIKACIVPYVADLLKIDDQFVVVRVFSEAFRELVQGIVDEECLVMMSKLLKMYIDRYPKKFADYHYYILGYSTLDSNLLPLIKVFGIKGRLSTLPTYDNILCRMVNWNSKRFFDYVRTTHGRQGFLDIFAYFCRGAVTISSFKTILTKEFFDSMGVDAIFYDLLFDAERCTIGKEKLILLKESRLHINEDVLKLYIPWGIFAVQKWKLLGLPSSNILKSKYVISDVTDLHRDLLRSVFDGTISKKDSSRFPKWRSYSLVKVKGGKKIYVGMTKLTVESLVDKTYVEGNYGEYLREFALTPLDEIRLVRRVQVLYNDFAEIPDDGSVNHWNTDHFPDLKEYKEASLPRKSRGVRAFIPVRETSSSEYDSEYESQDDDVY